LKFGWGNDLSQNDTSGAGVAGERSGKISLADIRRRKALTLFGVAAVVIIAVIVIAAAAHIGPVVAGVKAAVVFIVIMTVLTIRMRRRLRETDAKS
jgi:hypothetical protein